MPPEQARAVASRLIAEGPRAPAPNRRPHRGLLPDVDLATAVAAPRRTHWVRRLFARAFRKPAVKAVEGERTRPATSPLGTRPPPTYMGVTEAGDPASFHRSCEPQTIILSRAA